MNTVIFSFLATVGAELTKTHAVLFLIYFVLNVMDLLTGVMDSKLRGGYDSNKFIIGIFKKVGYWCTVALAWIVHLAFVQLGSAIDVDLGVTKYLGWFVLGGFIFQEIRSVLSNLVEFGIEVPDILSKVLSIGEQKLGEGKQADGTMVIDTTNPERDIYRLEVDGDVHELADKDSVTFKVQHI